MIFHPVGESYSHAMRPSELVLGTGLATMTNSSSRILVSRSKPIGAPDFPPTPPMYSRQSSASHSSSQSVSSDSKGSPSAGFSRLFLMKTPHRRNSPPTPDLTPARESRTVLLLPNSRNDPSSGSNSFKTAREDPYSSDEDFRLTIHPVLSCTHKFEADFERKLTNSKQRQNEHDFHTMIESDRIKKSPKKKQIQNSNIEFGKFDGKWGPEEDMNNETVERNLGMINHAAIPDQLIQHTYSKTFHIRDKSIDIHQPKRVTRTLSLQDYTKRRRENEPARRSFAEIQYARKAVPSTPSVQKLKELSPTSTSIEENFTEMLPARRKTLRHTKKCMGLRDLGDPNIKSTVLDTSAQGDLQHAELLDTSILNPYQPTHTRVFSTGSIGSNLSLKHRKEIIKNGGIPVLVIPERLTRSKSKPPSLRSTSSRKTRRSMSLGSAPWSHSTKFYHSEFSDRGGLPSRMVSVSANSGNSVRTIDYPPYVPTRRSSLSVRSNSNASRTGSLTAESLKAHNLFHAKKPTLEIKPCSGLPAIEINGFESSLILDPNVDSIQGNRLSSQITPFSQISNETTGTVAEVSEALAVSLFPHQNKSLVLVQNRQSSEPEPPSSSPTLRLTRKNDPVVSNTINRDTSAISPIIPMQPINQIMALDSPFSNPRDPPKPPTHIISDGSDSNHRKSAENVPTLHTKLPGRSKSLIRPRKLQSTWDATQPFGFIRRTLSAGFRPKSQSETSPNTPPKYRVVSDLNSPMKDKLTHSSKLHQFWRPAKFWDSLDDDGRYLLLYKE